MKEDQEDACAVLGNSGEVPSASTSVKALRPLRGAQDRSGLDRRFRFG
jgi:hypothetical protein